MHSVVLPIAPMFTTDSLLDTELRNRIWDTESDETVFDLVTLLTIDLLHSRIKQFLIDDVIFSFQLSFFMLLDPLQRRLLEISR